MKRIALIDGLSVAAFAAATAGRPVSQPEEQKREAPVPMIGTMQKHATRAQRRLHHKLKMQMKKEARTARYNLLQDAQADDKA